MRYVALLNREMAAHKAPKTQVSEKSASVLQLAHHTIYHTGFVAQFPPAGAAVRPL